MIRKALFDVGEWVNDTYGSIDPIVLEILRQDFPKPIMFRIGPAVVGPTLSILSEYTLAPPAFQSGSFELHAGVLRDHPE